MDHNRPGHHQHSDRKYQQGLASRVCITLATCDKVGHLREVFALVTFLL